MTRGTLTLIFAALAVPSLATEIDHASVGCVVADRFPRFEARFRPADGVARARVHFRPAKGRHWYSVPMKAEGDVFAGVLPKPRKELEGLSYYIEVLGADTTPTRTAEYQAVVASGPAACEDKKVASTVGSASVLLEVPAGAPPVPLGFSSAGIGAAAAGGGISTALLVGGGVVAAGGAVALSAGGGDSGPSGQQPGPSPSPGATPAPGPSPQAPGASPQPGASPAPNAVVWDMFFIPRIDVSSCAGRNVTWSSQAYGVLPDGTFDVTWAPNEPNTAHFRGQMTATSFDGTFSCVSNGNSVRFTASKSGNSFTGSFSFGGSSGTWSTSPHP